MQRMLTSVLILAAALGTACTGSLDDVSADPAVAAPTTPAAKTPATTPTEEEPATDPSDELEGEDPYFADPPPPPAGESDAGAPSEGDAGAPAEGPAETGAPAKPVAAAALANEAARELAVMKVTAYEHTTTIDEAAGTFKYDCSGFLGYALSRVLPTHLAAVKSFGAVTRPLAKHYQLFFASIAPKTVKSSWSRVTRAIDLKPGDVVAWLKPADLVSNNTGHVMIVRGLPTVNPKRADEVIVPVTDSTASFHGPSDTRAPVAGDGLGNGPIGIVVDAAGAPLRYRWTGAYSTKEYSTPISFGRPE